MDWRDWEHPEKFWIRGLDWNLNRAVKLWCA